MTDLAPFGTRLARFRELRGLPAIGPVGDAPDDTLLRRLAPELGLHTSDLFLIAGRAVPDDLAPAQLDGPWNVARPILHEANRLNAAGLARMRQFIDELPVSAVRRTRPFPSDGYDATAGVILRRLLANRNIRPDAGLFLQLAGGPYVSTSTYWMATSGRIPLAGRFVNPIARVVGIPVTELAALLGLATVEEPWERPHPFRTELAELAWAARRLDDAQILAVAEFSEVWSRR